MQGKALAIVGWSGSGKTTLIEALLPRLAQAGRTVSVIKQTHHDVDPDPPGKDTWRHRRAGAREVMLVTPRRWVLTHELGVEPAPDPKALMARFAPCDLILLEGFKHAHLPKLEVWRSALGRPPLYPQDPRILAVASDVPLPGIRRYDLHDLDAISRFILEEIHG